MRALILLLVLSIPTVAALAGETVRCGSSLVSSSSTAREVLAKCGEPTSKEKTVEDVYAKSLLGGTTVVGTTTTEKWIYDRGPRQFLVIVTVVDGEVTNLESKAR